MASKVHEVPSMLSSLHCRQVEPHRKEFPQ
jgi:hypothetical protein